MKVAPDLKSIAQQIKTLRRKLARWNFLYYEKNQPEVSDAIYDHYYRKLRYLEARYPQFQDASSPTQKVGYQVGSQFEKITHQRSMLSLDNAFSYADLVNFEKRVNKITNNKHTYHCELKIDGLPVNLVFKNHVLQYCVTRGDGEVGENVTANFLTLADKFDFIRRFPDANFELRGEVYMSKQAFRKLNQNLQHTIQQRYTDDQKTVQNKLGLLLAKFPAVLLDDHNPQQLMLDFTWNQNQVFTWHFQLDLKNLTTRQRDHFLTALSEWSSQNSALWKTTWINEPATALYKLTIHKSCKIRLFFNARNAAAGSLRQLDSAVTAKRNLAILFFDFWSTDQNLAVTTQVANLAKITKLQLPVAPFSEHCENLTAVWKWIQKIHQKRHQLPMEIDGAVIKVNEMVYHQALGATAKFPHSAIAYKFPDLLAESQLLRIETTIGRTGKVGYVAHLRPTFLLGSIVKKATLHNADFIQKLELRINDYVRFKKAGGIIPRIIGVDLTKRSPQTIPWQKPQVCPFCKELLVVYADEVDQHCVNLQCPQIVQRSMQHFVAQPAFNIRGLSKQTLAKLYQLKLIRNGADIFALPQQRDRLEKLIQDRILTNFQSKSLTNLLTAITQAKQQPLERLLVALGVRHLGTKAARLLAEHFQNLDKMLVADPAAWLNLFGIGDQLVDSWKRFTANSQNRQLLHQLKAHGVNTTQPQRVATQPHWLNGKKVVITGTFPIARPLLIKKLEAHQVQVLSQLSRKVDYLLVGEQPGQKREQAQAYNVPLLNIAALTEFWTK